MSECLKGGNHDYTLGNLPELDAEIDEMAERLSMLETERDVLRDFAIRSHTIWQKESKDG